MLWPDVRTHKDQNVKNLHACTHCEGITATPIPITPIEEMSDEFLNKTLAHFIMEVQKKEGARYPPNTFHSLMMGLQISFNNAQ